MLELRRERKRRVWLQPRWWAVLAVALLIGQVLSSAPSPRPAWHQRAVFEAAAQVSRLLHVPSPQVTRPQGSAATEASATDAAVSPSSPAVAQEELRQECGALRELLRFPEGELRPRLAARVVRHDMQMPYHTIVIDRGIREGVARGMIVVAQGGLVGRVERVSTRFSTVLLLTDPTHAVDVVVQRSRARGILRGEGNMVGLGQHLGVSRLEYLLGTTDIMRDDVIVTSGLDGRYPAGIAVGTVGRIMRSPHGLLREAEVVPVIDWTRLERVGLLDTHFPPPAVAPQAGMP